MKKPVIAPATYAKLKKFATAGGKIANLGIILGTDSGAVITAYLDHMKANDKALHKSWGSKYAPPDVEEDEDDDPTAGLSDDDEDPTAGLEEETVTTPEPAPPVARKSTSAPKSASRYSEATAGLDDLFPATGKGVMVTTDEDGGGINVPVGTSMHIPEKFRLRNADGTDTILEVFSRSPKFGYIVRVPVPTDMRTLTIGGNPVELDLLTLRRDPDGMTEVGGKRYSNSKLIAAVELS